MQTRYWRCTRCMTMNLEPAEECSNCGAQPQGTAPASRPGPRRGANRSQNHSPKGSPGAANIVRFVVAAIALVAGVITVGASFRPTRVPDVQLASTDGAPDPCIDVDRCIAVYLAPWCPACTGSHHLVRALQERSDQDENFGFKAIVGLDEQPALEKYADSIGGQVFIDGDRVFRRAFGGGGTPTWWMWDGDRALIAKLSAGFSSGAGLMKFMVEDELGTLSPGGSKAKRSSSRPGNFGLALWVLGILSLLKGATWAIATFEANTTPFWFWSLTYTALGLFFI